MQEIDLRRIDLNLLVVFDVLMAERSVTRAAARLARTQSAISHALARLRDQLGDPLLVKSGGRMRASPRAEELAEEVRAILAATRRVLAVPAPFDPGRSTRTFRVAFPDLTTGWFGSLAAAVRDAAPGVVIEWVHRDDRTPLAVAEGHVDLALYPSVVVLPDGVASEPAGEFRWATFARRRHPAAAAWGKAAWRKHPHVAVRVGAGIPSPIEATGRDAQGRRIGAWVPHFSAVAPLLAATDLLATLPMIAMADTLERYDLIALKPPLAIPPMPHRLIWSARLGREPGLAWLRDHVRRTFTHALASSESLVTSHIRQAGPRGR